MKYYLRLIHLVNGPGTMHDGQYLVYYDPHTPEPPNWTVTLRTSEDIADARPFDTAKEALDYYRQAIGIRADGKPDRPLTAYTVALRTVELRQKEDA